MRGRKPLAVGGRPETRGVVATCNYEARRYGIHSAMASAQALKRCPDLIILPPAMEKYRVASRQILTIYRDYTNLVEPLSLDEAYLDVTENKLGLASATLAPDAAALRGGAPAGAAPVPGSVEAIARLPVGRGGLIPAGDLAVVPAHAFAQLEAVGFSVGGNAVFLNQILSQATVAVGRKQAGKNETRQVVVDVV